MDNATGGWGHINVDHIVLTDRKVPGLLRDQSREFVIEKHYLNLPVKDGAPNRHVTVLVEGRVERRFDIELADAAPDWWAVLEVSAWKGRNLALQLDRLPEDSAALKSIEQGDTIKGGENLYREALRPQFHFSSRRGWNNDPNGLVYYKDTYHLFYQHNPFGWKWGNMHWGHAVSLDLVHWQEEDDALAPDNLGPMFSGSAVVDRNNASGLGQGGQPPLVLIYTAAGNPTVQCIASSCDGRSFAKFRGNPVVKEISGGNRDPKVLWFDPLKQWVMALYVGLPVKPGQVDKKGRPASEHTIHFLTSPNLKDWTVRSHSEGFFECPDLFELPVDGNPQNGKWVLTAADSAYMLGAFDGTAFASETEKLKGHCGRGFYAAQTFSDIPSQDGRRIQIGWLQAPSPGMPFNQALSIPLELTLLSTPEGPRLARQPVNELKILRAKGHRAGPRTLKEGDANPLADIGGELLEVRADFEPDKATETAFTVRGVPIVYVASKQEIVVNGHRAPAPLRGGRQRLIVYADRTAFEVFASDGLTYVPMPLIPKAENRSLGLSVKGGAVKFEALETYELRSAWKKAQ